MVGVQFMTFVSWSLLPVLSSCSIKDEGAVYLARLAKLCKQIADHTKQMCVQIQLQSNNLVDLGV